MSGSFGLPVKRPLSYDDDFVADFDEDSIDDPMPEKGKSKKSYNSSRGGRQDNSLGVLTKKFVELI
jgi:hypothetical protein